MAPTFGPLPPLPVPPRFTPFSASEAAEARAFGGAPPKAPASGKGRGKGRGRPGGFTPASRAKAAETRARNAAAKKAGKAPPSKPGRAGKRGAKAPTPAQSLLARFRGVKRGSPEYMKLKKELRQARVAKGYKGKAPLRRRPISRRPAMNATMVRPGSMSAAASAGKQRKPSKPQASAPTTGKQRQAKAEREQRKQSYVGQIETQFDRNRGIVRGITVVGVAVGAVKLNQKYPDGLTPLGLEASTVVALSTTAAALTARHFGYKRVASLAVDVTIGAVTGTLASNVGSGKTPLIAKKP